jgi:Domain of unknown function (DUF4861)
MRMKYPAFLSLLLVAAAASHAADRLVVTVSNPLDLAREAEVIVVPFAEVQRELGKDVLSDHVIVRDAKGAVVVSQITRYNSTPKAEQVELLFQHSFAAGEKKAVFTVEKSEEIVPPYPAKVFARAVPERYDDFAWENDRLGHRAYGPGLTLPSAGKDQMVSSGLDVWCKRVDYPVVDRWYRDGHYHKDTGEGMDMYDVGASRGCGGTGVWSDHKLYPAVNYTAYRVLANGPIRAVFELSFPLWDADGFQLSEVKRFTVDAGRSLDRIDSTFSFATHAASGETKLFIAAGLAKHKTNGAVTKNESERWLSYWEDYGKNGQLGTAVVLDPEQDIQFAEDRLNHLAVTRLGGSKRLTYYAGAGWTNSPYFKSEQDWHAYLSAFTAALKAPLQVEYSSK